MQNPVTILRALARRPEPRPPYLLPGYKAPQKMTARDYLAPVSHWPLVWVLDIHGYDTVSRRSSGQASFTLSGGYDGQPGTTLQCSIPLADGELFDKEGAYIVVALPATDRAQVDAILDLARGR